MRASGGYGGPKPAAQLPAAVPFFVPPPAQPVVLSRERERNVLFNDTLNTFYLRLYGVTHMVKDHSDSEKRNPLPPHRLLLSSNSKGSFIYHALCYTSRGALAGTRNSSMGPPHEGSIRRPIAP